MSWSSSSSSSSDILSRVGCQLVKSCPLSSYNPHISIHPSLPVFCISLVLVSSAFLFLSRGSLFTYFWSSQRVWSCCACITHLMPLHLWFYQFSAILVQALAVLTGFLYPSTVLGLLLSIHSMLHNSYSCSSTVRNCISHSVIRNGSTENRTVFVWVPSGFLFLFLLLSHYYCVRDKHLEHQVIWLLIFEISFLWLFHNIAWQ